MKDNDNVRSIECARAMDRIHRRLDGEDLDLRSRDWLEGHLAACASCRQAKDELRQIQDVLRGLASDEFPDEGLDRVWAETTRASDASRRVRRTDWRVAAAAVVLISALFGLWQVLRPLPPSPELATVAAPTKPELQRAAAEARMVLGLTASALRRTEEVAVEEVLGRRISPAIGKIPIRWPGGAEARDDRKREGDGNV